MLDLIAQAPGLGFVGYICFERRLYFVVKFRLLLIHSCQILVPFSSFTVGQLCPSSVLVTDVPCTFLALSWGTTKSGGTVKNFPALALTFEMLSAPLDSPL